MLNFDLFDKSLFSLSTSDFAVNMLCILLKWPPSEGVEGQCNYMEDGKLPNPHELVHETNTKSKNEASLFFFNTTIRDVFKNLFEEGYGLELV